MILSLPDYPKSLKFNKAMGISLANFQWGQFALGVAHTGQFRRSGLEIRFAGHSFTLSLHGPLWKTWSTPSPPSFPQGRLPPTLQIDLLRSGSSLVCAKAFRVEIACGTW